MRANVPADHLLVVTGHSQGAPISLMAALFLAIDYRKPDAVITFASPNVGGKEFSDLYHKAVGCDRTLQYFSFNDSIATFPPRMEKPCPAQQPYGELNSSVHNLVKIVEELQRHYEFRDDWVKFCHVPFGLGSRYFQAASSWAARKSLSDCDSTKKGLSEESDPNGVLYRGCQNRPSKEEHCCAPWYSNVYVAPHNYCRNPNNDPRGPWCFLHSGVVAYCAEKGTMPQESRSACDVRRAEL